MFPGVPVRLPQHADEHRPKDSVLLAVDQELGEGPCLGVPSAAPDRVGAVEVGQHEDVEQLGAGSWAEGVEALTESALELVGAHGRRLRGRAGGAEALSRLRERRSERDQRVERG
jgi:hypothetical protein